MNKRGMEPSTVVVMFLVLVIIGAVVYFFNAIPQMSPQEDSLIDRFDVGERITPENCDPNGDGVTNPEDAEYIYGMLYYPDNYPVLSIKKSDCDGDGEITLDDKRALEVYHT